MCSKYRGVRLLEYGMKLWKILEKRLREMIKIDESGPIQDHVM